jgi:hypothetical protein
MKFLAQDSIDLTPQGDFAALGDITVTGVISAVIALILVIAALIFFFMLVFGGIKYITSGGDKAQTEAARNQITAALIGLVIVFAAWAIVNLAGTFLGGFDLTNLTIPSITN